jgi:transcriptional regulator with XRE-family HTH domain
MKAKEIIAAAMQKDKITQKELAEAMGLKSAQAIGNILYRDSSVRVSSFAKMLDIMGYEIVVRKKIGASEEWKVDQ